MKVFVVCFHYRSSTRPVDSKSQPKTRSGVRGNESHPHGARLAVLHLQAQVLLGEQIKAAWKDA